ncbi:MAG TPA: sigma-70 family RNA polymerase sigma factor [Ktedonobacteraceae bacterium]|nr:sigma-70 family RNA polymerase sigma factor [Ktedonobacteraceae bacterium]
MLQQRQGGLVYERAGPTTETEDFEAEVLAQRESLYRTALRMTHHPEEAEDLVQETLFRAFRFAHTYQPGSNVRAWLFRILHNLAINQYRKQATQPAIASLPEEEECFQFPGIKDLGGRTLTGAAEEEVLSMYLGEDVAEALAKLPLHARRIVLLAVEGLSYKEIAEVLQIPLGTVMSRLSRARRHLQHELRSYAQQEGYVKETAEAGAISSPQAEDQPSSGHRAELVAA